MHATHNHKQVNKNTSRHAICSGHSIRGHAHTHGLTESNIKADRVTDAETRDRNVDRESKRKEERARNCERQK